MVLLVTEPISPNRDLEDQNTGPHEASFCLIFPLFSYLFIYRTRLE